MGRVVHCPEDERLSVWRAEPTPSLARYVKAYHAFDARLGPGEEGIDVLAPDGASLVFTLEGEPWGVRLGRRRFDPAPRDALFGPSSLAGFSRFGPGHVVRAGLTPLGWARFMRLDASLHTDRIADLRDVWPERMIRLRAALEADRDPAAAFDELFTGLLPLTGPDPDEEASARLAALLADPALLTATDLASRMGMLARPLARMSARHFGFTPKLLLRRARFMRATIEMLRTERGGWRAIVERAGYHDHSHYIRDCRSFLDMPMSEFVEMSKPFFTASLRLRATPNG